MSSPKLILLILLMLLLSHQVSAQLDSSIISIQQIPGKYFTQVNKKVDQYTHRLSSKTEKALTKLCRWESRVHSLLQKASPETAQRLFANKELTFAGVLEKLQQGKTIAANATASYNENRKRYVLKIKANANYRVSAADIFYQ